MDQLIEIWNISFFFKISVKKHTDQYFEISSISHCERSRSCVSCLPDTADQIVFHSFYSFYLIFNWLYLWRKLQFKSTSTNIRQAWRCISEHFHVLSRLKVYFCSRWLQHTISVVFAGKTKLLASIQYVHLPETADKYTLTHKWY